MSQHAVQSALNTLLNEATGGACSDIQVILEKAAKADILEGQLNTEKEEKKKAIDAAEEDRRNFVKAMAPKPSAATGIVKVASTDLIYKVEMKPAHDVFDEVAKKKEFSFEIPVLMWYDAAGNLVLNEEVPAIDTNYDFDHRNLLKFLTGLNRRMNQWLFGHTGTGKTTFVEQVAARMGWPVTRINLDSNLERSDLVGHVGLAEENGTTVSKFEEGILPRAMVKPGILLMDEIDAGRPDILFTVQRALEHNGLTLTEDSARLVKSHELFRFVATANTRGQGDEYGMYPGTRTMNASMLDRFTSFIEFEYLTPARELVLLKKIEPGLSEDMGQKITQFASEIRKAFGKGEVYNTISPRGLMVLGGCYVSFQSYGLGDKSLRMALDMAILDKVTNDTRQKFIEIGSRVFAERIA